MASPIERLPVELIDMIVACLTLPNYQNLRLASKQLCSLTLATFSKRYFSKRTTTLGPPSLSRLLQSSTHKIFAETVTLLDVKLLSHEEYCNLQRIARVGIYPPPKRFPKVPRIKVNDLSQEATLFDYMRNNEDPKEVVGNLGRALEGFSSLQTVRVRVDDSVLRFRHVEWSYHCFLTSCFKAVLRAIVRSGVKLQIFSLTKGPNIHSLTKSANVLWPAFDHSIPFTLSLGVAFSFLKSLSLSLRTEHHGCVLIPGWQNGISRFISSATALEELVLCLEARDTAPKLRSCVIESLATSLELPHLKLLHLYGCAFDGKDLVHLVTKHASTLRRLIINKSYMLEGTWETALASFRDALKLDYIVLSSLRQSTKPRAIWWQPYGTSKAKKKFTLDAIVGRERRDMREMLTEAINFLPAVPDDFGS